jgi:tetratricopeptide (TPR) repeat protein
MKDVEEKKESGGEGGADKTGGDDYSLGLAFYQTDMLDDALERFEKSVRKPDRLEGSLFYIGMIHFRRGDYEKAVLYFKQLLEENPENLVAYNNLAVTFEKEGLVKEAELLYREAQKISPLASQVIANIGILQYHRGEYKKARKNLQRAVHLNRSMAFAYFYLGMTCLKLSKWDEAEENLEQSLRLSPDNPIIHNNLGILCRMTGDFTRGLRYSLWALELDDNLSRAFDNVDKIFCLIGEWGECLKSLDEAVPDRERNLHFLIRLADYYFSKGDYEMTHQILQKGREVDPDNRRIKERFEKLNDLNSS